MLQITKGLFLIAALLLTVGCARQFHWAYIIDQGGEAVRIERSSGGSVSLNKLREGEYIVTFPERVNKVGCTATLNNSVGFVTCVPGDKSGLAANQVRVLTLNPDNTFGTRDFTVVVYPSR